MVAPFQLFGREISIYTICALLGLLAAGAVLFFLAKKKGIAAEDVVIPALFGCLGMLLGGALLYGLTNIRYIAREIAAYTAAPGPVWPLLGRLLIYFQGSVFYGGLFGGLLAGLLYVRHNQWDTAAYCDLFAPGIALFHAFGRVGCFMVGCCYGVPCAWGTVYRYSPIPSANGVPRFPVQLAEAGFELLLFCLLFALFQKNRCKGRLLTVYLLAYAPARFVLEFFRGDTYRGFLFGLSTSQWISLLVLAVLLARAVWRNWRKAQRRRLA